ncbi:MULTISPECIES: thiamine-phosphate synthase family protein [unclassified Haladaptatus]|uniref:thiamine-phosphate synthase family protein n=1 Tax=unclassified Haladaptatus TaxID=2622732 RepID=UPI0023E84DBE|nr:MULTISPECIES: thiamine-phosphate synthase family protein [unclassified Haladaptatus]
MRFVEEIVVDEFLPTFRSMLAEALRDRGLTQSEVAAVLGISQSAVSKYAHGEVTRNQQVLEDERVVNLVTRLADGLAEGDMTPVQGLIETEVLIRQLERGDLLAQLHEAEMPALARYDGPLSIHDPESGLRASERVLSSVRRGIRTLQNTSGFAALIPNVGSNLVECLPDAATIDDVVGVPGRIFDVKGTATVPGEPEFGVSEHVASVLLAARRNGSPARAALNIRYDDRIASALDDAGYTAATFDADLPLDEAIDAALADDPTVDVLSQPGGFGIEPITYLLGSDAQAVAERVRDLV